MRSAYPGYLEEGCVLYLQHVCREYMRRILTPEVPGEFHDDSGER